MNHELASLQARSRVASFGVSLWVVMVVIILSLIGSADGWIAVLTSVDLKVQSIGLVDQFLNVVLA